MNEATSEATTVELFICERCAVWREPSSVTFNLVGALRHAVECHGNKVESAVLLSHVERRGPPS